MTKEIEKHGEKFYQCEECKFIYKDKSWAEKCEEWCKKTKSCNLDITKHAINKKQ